MSVETKEQSKQWMHTHSPNKSKMFKQIFMECILLCHQTDLISVFYVRSSKNVYPYNCLLKITTCFDHPTGHHQVIQYFQVFFNYNHFN
jgi:hypothetical protein